ncbi:MAG: ImmA/IrrE family metallo-endopeptidase, partial [Eggerthellaceae bacterium]|nr:ImmA/IrrE family metallo-endopeptidase [Eggerthellaceae bacterium]
IHLFSQYNIKSMPIRGFDLASKMGIILIPYSSLSSKKRLAACQVSFDGFYLEPGDGKEYIFYNDMMGYSRLNMTILHEIGHCVLGHHDKMNQDEAEAEAKFFAKYAAAPPPLIHLLNPKGPKDIKDAFMISLQAATYAFGYYKKWLKQYQKTGSYFAYELQLLRLFEKSA